MARRPQNLDAGGDEKLKINFMWPNVHSREEICTATGPDVYSSHNLHFFNKQQQESLSSS